MYTHISYLYYFIFSEHNPAETRPSEPASRPRRVAATPKQQTPETRRSELSRPKRTPNTPMSKPEARPAEIELSYSAEVSRPKRTSSVSRPAEPTVDISAPSWEIPDFQEPTRSLPPARPPPPPPEEEELPPPPKPELPPPKPVEPVYSQVQKSKPSPHVSPLGWDHSEVQQSKPSPRTSPQGWDLPAQVEPPPPLAQPAFQTSTPATSSSRWETKTETEVHTVTVGSGFVNAEVKKVDLGGDKSEDEVSADAYRNQLAKMANLIKRSDSPRGWSSATKAPSQIRPVRAPKPPTTGQTGNAYLDSKKARENFFNTSEPNAPPKAPGSPYDRESYQAHKERTKKRSQSPGRQYQERSGIYPPQNSYDKKKPAFKPIPVE